MRHVGDYSSEGGGGGPEARGGVGKLGASTGTVGVSVVQSSAAATAAVLYEALLVGVFLLSVVPVLLLQVSVAEAYDFYRPRTHRCRLTRVGLQHVRASWNKDP